MTALNCSNVRTTKVAAPAALNKKRQKAVLHVSWNVNYGAPVAVVATQHGDKAFQLLGVHPPPPAKPQWHQLRNDLMSHLAREASLQSLIVAGDFNATPWSAAMPRHSLFRATSLQPTWLGILPIDHIMTTRDWAAIDSGVGPDVGPDHRPVWARLVSLRAFEQPRDCEVRLGEPTRSAPCGAP